MNEKQALQAFGIWKSDTRMALEEYQVGYICIPTVIPRHQKPAALEINDLYQI
jgi:hypothetical protein